MQPVILAIHVLISIGIIVLVLLQHGRGADVGAAFGSGASGSMFGSRGPTSFLTRLTTIFVTVFFLTSLSLAWLAAESVDRRSVVDRVQPAPTAPVEAPEPDAGAPGPLPDAPPAPPE